MIYAAASHVEGLNQGRRTFAASSTPALGQVNEWLAQTAGIIDGVLKERGYSVPVSPTAASSALVTLANFNAAGAWYLVESSAKVRDEEQFKEAKAMWENAQKMLVDGIIELDLAIDAEEALPRSGFDSTATAWFTRDMEL